MKKNIILAVALFTTIFSAQAYDFSAVTQIGAASQTTLYYNIKTTATVELVGPGGANINTWDGSAWLSQIL